MAIDVTKTLRQALAALEAEKARISRQIESIQQVIASGRLAPRQAKRRIGTPDKKKRPPLSATARKAVSQRMKAYWAKRKAQAKVKGTGDT
jgi:hypothetical protein